VKDESPCRRTRAASRGHPPLVDGARVPSGQHVVDEFPVLSFGHDAAHAARRVDVPGQRRARSTGLVDVGGAARAPRETPTVDIHCVTAWSKLDTMWTGVFIDTLLAGLKTEADQVSAWCDDGYRTNLRLEDVTGGRAWIAYEYGASLGVVVIGLGVLLRDLLLALLGALLGAIGVATILAIGNLAVERPITCSDA
jgi:DMSO/TMAO reductase YedYZ molybdopterin-dependent catalytic subunit